MDVQCELKIASFRVTVWHHFAKPRDASSFSHTHSLIGVFAVLMEKLFVLGC